MQTINIQTDQFPNIHYRKAGTGPAIVLLHGFPEDGNLWDNVYAALSSHYTVIIPDIPGSGQSSLGEKEITMESLAGSIADILANEKIEEAVVVGHSMGGYITMAFAESHRPWLKGISLVHSTATADTDEKKETRRKSVELIRKGGKEPFVKGMIPNLFAKTFKDDHPEVMDRQVERGLSLPEDSMIAFYNAMINRPDRTATLTTAAVPVQWIIGREDSVVPLDVAMKQARLADVNFVSLYDNCGHMSMLEHPERLANDLREFVSYCYKYN